MSDLSYHHGSRVFDLAGQWLDVRLANASVINLTGTAPDADAATWPLDRPVLIKGPADLPKLTKLGRAGTLYRAIEQIFDQGGTSKLGAYIYVTRVAQATSAAETLSNVVGDNIAMTGINAARKIPSIAGYGSDFFKPRIFIAPGFTSSTATDGVRSVAMDQQGIGYSSQTTMRVVGGGGRGCVLKPIIDEDGHITGAIVVKPGWGYTGTPTIEIEDPAATPGSGAQAQAIVGVVGNPVAHEMTGVAAQFRAVGFIDGPNTTDEAAVLARESYGSDRLYMIDPSLNVYDNALMAFAPSQPSAIFAGVQVRTDRDKGFVKSVSNELLFGVDGPVRPIHYGTQTNYLNQNRVATVINYGDGWKTWGNRTTSGMFLAVRRSRDLINEAVETAYLRAADRPMTEFNLRLLEEIGQDFLTMLERRGYVMSGSSNFRVSSTKNTKGAMQQGRIVFDMRYETPPPMEDIVIEATDNIQAYDLLIDRLASDATGQLIETRAAL
jgi:phage tail sheath protein FI